MDFLRDADDGRSRVEEFHEDECREFREVIDGTLKHRSSIHTQRRID